MATLPYAAIGGLSAGLAAALALLWWYIPKWQIRTVTTFDPKERSEIEDNFRKTIGQALGGLAILFTGIVGYLEFYQQQQSARELLISNQVSKGFEQLAGQEIPMRLGGIYLLEGVINTSDQYYQPLIEALCAFVRERTKSSNDTKISTDVQAALTVIIRRRLSDDPNLHLSISSTYVDVEFSPQKFDFSGYRRLKDQRRLDLYGINIPGANLDYAHLSEAYLSNAHLADVALSDAHLIDADLSSANLQGAYLTSTILVGADLGVANLTGAHLTSTDLRAAQLNFVKFNKAELVGANLAGSDLTKADLSGAKLIRTDLRNTNITQDQLSMACGSDNKLPAGLILKPCLAQN